MSDKESGPAERREPGDPGADGETGQHQTGGKQEDAGTGNAQRPGGQAELLAEMKALRRRARTARHAYWFPLVLFGVLTCASVPFYAQPGDQAGETGAQAGPPLPILGGSSGLTSQRFLGYYWLAALVGGLLLTLLWYRRNARRVGLATPARGFVVATAALTMLALAIPLLSQVRSPHWLSWLQHLQVLWPGDLMMRGTFPFVIIAVGLWILAWAERSLALTVIATVYTAAALLSSLYNTENILFRLGWNPPGSDWTPTSLPNLLLPALVLLATGAGAFAVQRRHRIRT
jgi:hypothetical protein